MNQKNPHCKGVATGLPTVNVSAVVKTAADIQKVMGTGINGDGSLKPETIRALLKFKGINLRVLAETNGYLDPWLHQIINREYPDIRVRRLLADAIGFDYERVWGEVADAS